jgi:hypothetical protein
MEEANPAFGVMYGEIPHPPSPLSISLKPPLGGFVVLGSPESRAWSRACDELRRVESRAAGRAGKK